MPAVIHLARWVELVQVQYPKHSSLYTRTLQRLSFLLVGFLVCHFYSLKKLSLVASLFLTSTWLEELGIQSPCTKQLRSDFRLKLKPSARRKRLVQRLLFLVVPKSLNLLSGLCDPSVLESPWDQDPHPSLWVLSYQGCQALLSRLSIRVTPEVQQVRGRSACGNIVSTRNKVIWAKLRVWWKKIILSWDSILSK